MAAVRTLRSGGVGRYSAANRSYISRRSAPISAGEAADASADAAERDQAIDHGRDERIVRPTAEPALERRAVDDRLAHEGQPRVDAEEGRRGTQPADLGRADVQCAERPPGALEPGVEPRVADELDHEIGLGGTGSEQEQQKLLGAVRAGVDERPAPVVDRQPGGRRRDPDVARRPLDAAGIDRAVEDAELPVESHGRARGGRSPRDPPDPAPVPSSPHRALNEVDQRSVPGRDDRPDLAGAGAQPEHPLPVRAERQLRAGLGPGLHSGRTAQPGEHRAVGRDDPLEIRAELSVDRQAVRPPRVEDGHQADARGRQRTGQLALRGDDQLPADLLEGGPGRRGRRPRLRIVPSSRSGRR